MKRYTSKEYEQDCRICGYYNGAPLNIARAVTDKVLSTEKPHYHKEDFEYYIFLRGSGEMIINDEFVKYNAGDVVMVEPGEIHKVARIIEETDYMTIRSNVLPGDKNIVE